MQAHPAHSKAQSVEGSGLRGGAKRYALATELNGRGAADVAEVGLGQVEQSADAALEEGGAGAGLGEALSLIHI